MPLFGVLKFIYWNADCHYTDCRYAECHYAECHYAECHYSECHYAECHYAECYYAECHYAKCHYAECHYSERRYAECRGAVYQTKHKELMASMEQYALKNVDSCLNTNIYSYLEISGGKGSKLYLNVVHFFNTSVN